MEIKLVTIKELIFLPLILYVLADSVFIETDRGDEVSSAPEALLSESAFFGEQIVSSDGTLPLEKSHGIGHGMFGWNAQNHVHMIGTGVAFEHFDVFLFGKFPDDFADLHSGRTKKDFLTVLGYDDHVVLTIPDHVIL